MSRLSLLVFGALLVATFAQFCPQCQEMCRDARANFKQDFSKVTAGQLQTFMESECKLKFTGPSIPVCTSFVDQNSGQMLKDFQNGLSDQQICQNGGLC
ncbi:unnamed protein product, partial [Mesorhabditis belari]|uniref:Saposin B-type domain-containing protein n=1 Tax=Mesorhabditis belari TaxID=2138241 RepID=A0AAF3J2A9_9BILA